MSELFTGRHVGYGLMKQYRMKVGALYAPDSSQVLTPLPGHTPDTVDLTGTCDLAAARAELSWTASTDPELASYELRSTPGPDSAAGDESTVASIPPGGPLAYPGSAGFGQSRNAVSYKVSASPAGSDAVTVTRPL